MDFQLGQIWQVTWIQGSEVLPSHGRSHRTRTGILTGSEAINGEATNLYFSLPMVESRRNNRMTANELLILHADGKAKLLGRIQILLPWDEKEMTDEEENPGEHVGG